MKFVLLGACVPLDIAPVACKGNPLHSRSHQERPACPLTHLPKGVRMEPLQRNGPKLLLPGTQEVCSLCLWHPQGKLRSQSHGDQWLLLVLRRVSVPGVWSPPQPQNWVSLEALARVTSRCSKPLDSTTLFHPFSHFRKMSPWKELEEDNFFCCWLSVVPFHGFKIHLSESVQLHFVLFHHLNASSWSEEIKAI